MTVQNWRVRQLLSDRDQTLAWRNGYGLHRSHELNQELRYESSSHGSHRSGLVHPQRERWRLRGVRPAQYAGA